MNRKDSLKKRSVSCTTPKWFVDPLDDFLVQELTADNESSYPSYKAAMAQTANTSLDNSRSQSQTSLATNYGSFQQQVNVLPDLLYKKNVRLGNFMFLIGAATDQSAKLTCTVYIWCNLCYVTVHASFFTLNNRYCIFFSVVNDISNSIPQAASSAWNF